MTAWFWRYMPHPKGLWWALTDRVLRFDDSEGRERHMRKTSVREALRFVMPLGWQALWRRVAHRELGCGCTRSRITGKDQAHCHKHFRKWAEDKLAELKRERGEQS